MPGSPPRRRTRSRINLGSRSAKSLAIRVIADATALEEAHRIYTDLREYDSRSYNQYIRGGKDNAAWFVREKENLTLGGHRMDSITYKFQNGKFFSVGIGVSCDEDTACNAEQVYQDIIKAIRRLYGKPYEIGSRTYEDENTVRKRGGVTRTEEIEWKLDDESISVSKTLESLAL